MQARSMSPATVQVPDRPLHKSPLPLAGQLVLLLQVRLLPSPVGHLCLQLLAVVLVHDHLTLEWTEVNQSTSHLRLCYSFPFQLSGLPSLPPMMFVVWTLVGTGLHCISQAKKLL